MAGTAAIEAAESYFLTRLFSGFNEAKIRYAVMRNYAPLPDAAGGSDLDIIVSPEDESRAGALLNDAIAKGGGVAIGSARAPGFLKVCALGPARATPSSWWGVCVDLNGGLLFQGQPVLGNGGAFPVCQHHGVAVLPDRLAAVLAVLKEAMNNGVVPARYLESARGAARQGWDDIAALLAPIGGKAISRLRFLLASDLSADEARRQCRDLTRSFLRHAFGVGPVAFVSRWAVYRWSKVARYLAPPGVVLAILGVDGAGKSTVINAILPVLQSATHNTVFVRHLRPGLLPPLARLKGQTTVPDGPVLEPHGSIPSGMVGSLLRLAYLTLDYVLGYWLRTRPIVAKQPTVVVFDRYAYDMALDPRRFRIGLSGRIVGWFASLAPKPDLIFCLQGEPEVIAARKGELSVEETRRQIDALKAFAAREPRAVLVATDTAIEASRDAVLSALVQYLRNRAKPGSRHV
jgi:thymidylate kinase